MLALRSSIQQSFIETLNKQMSVLDDMSERVSHVENKMGEFSEAHNSLVDAHNQLEDELTSLAAKLADLEDRNRKKMLWGVHESISPSDLILFVQRLIKTTLMSVTTHDLIIVMLPKPKGLPEETPRDVMLCPH